MLDAIQSLFTLRWAQRPQLRPLPDHVKRTFVPSPGGDLELLISKPKSTNNSSPAIFFTHGGYGSAGVWLEWMTYLHESGYQGTLYACSARNHGGSFSVPYFRMVYRTSHDDMASDLTTCLRHAQNQEATTQTSDANVVLVGHSSGGGLAQYCLANYPSDQV